MRGERERQANIMLAVTLEALVPTTILCVASSRWWATVWSGCRRASRAMYAKWGGP